MSNYKCSVREDIVIAWAEANLYLDPKDYLHCEDLNDLKWCIQVDLDCNINNGDFNVKEAEYDYDIPDEFYKEWQKLKNEQNS